MLQIQVTSVKGFMSKLLASDYFDDFLCVEGEIVTFNTFSFDGFIQKNYYQSSENAQNEKTFLADFSSWTELKDFCFSLIKGQNTPLSFKFVFKLSDGEVSSFIEKYGLDYTKEGIQGLYFNIRFENLQLKITTGTSLKTFNLSKDVEEAWDKELIMMMNELELDYELL